MAAPLEQAVRRIQTPAMRRCLIGLVLAAGLAATGLRAQQPAATSPQRQAPPPMFRGDVAAVLVDFRVTDGDGRFISDLTSLS